VPFVLVITCSSLLMVDHIHFQYNGLLLGVLLLSIASHLSCRVLLGGVLFAALLNLKHLYLVLAPVQFTLILRGWVWGSGWLFRLSAMATAVLTIFAVSLGPFIAVGELPQLLCRCGCLISVSAKIAILDSDQCAKIVSACPPGCEKQVNPWICQGLYNFHETPEAFTLSIFVAVADN
jgi:hypothetical protein